MRYIYKKMKSPLVKAIPLLLIISGCTITYDCEHLPQQNDGTPIEYSHQECIGNNALKNKDYSSAITAYKKALSIPLFESPNYELSYPLGVSLCKIGKYKQGIKQLHHFEMMAKAELNEIPCPANYSDEKMEQFPEYIFYACGGGASGLSEQGKIEMKQRLNTIPSLIQSCN